MKKKKLIHLSNPFKVAKGNASHLDIAQPVTFESFKRAKAHFDNNKQHQDWELVQCMVQYKEDRSIVPSCFTCLPDLKYSTLDYFSKQQVKRKLPLLRDILHAVHALSLAPEDVIIYSNIDIAIQEKFYDFVLRNAVIFDSFIINRRDIPKHSATGEVLGVADIQALYAEQGKPHPGFDCFIFPYWMLGKFDLGDVFLGYPPIGSVLKLNMERASSNFKIFREVYQTFHLGEDIAWRKDSSENMAHYHLNITLAKEAGFDFKPMKLL